MLGQVVTQFNIGRKKKLDKLDKVKAFIELLI